ncbi:MAG: methyltransferase domain-containing protein [Nitrospirae bacterium]|nr:methyltransferase domain-containing protein [Nitrospirota bacterium]
MRWDAEKYDAVKTPQIDAGRELIVMAEVRDTDSILDIGCGTGKLTGELARLASKGNITGIDPSQEMLERARLISAGIGNITLMQIHAQAMDFTNRFDLAFSNSALQWVKEQQDVLNRVYNSLKKGGRIAFQLPSENFCSEFFNYIKDAVALLGYEKYFKDWETPWYFPMKENYEAMLNDIRFDNIKVFYRTYKLIFNCTNEVLEWWSSAGLRPYPAALPEKEQEYFKYAFAMSFENNRTDRGIEFSFRRLFAFAEK